MRLTKKTIPLLLAVAFSVTAFLLPVNSVQAVTVQQEYINQNRSHQALNPIGLVIHDTDNNGATAQNNRDYFNRVYVAASAHYFVDWNTDIQTIPENEIAWHAGPTANHRYLSIEMCMPYGHDVAKFNQVYQNTVQLAADICKRHGWSSNNIVSHYWVSETFHETDHEDPIQYLLDYGKSWDTLINDIQHAIDGRSVVVVSQPVQINSNSSVITLQSNLNKIINAGLAVDGSPGPLTKAAVIKFQGIMGLEQDGFPGPITRGAINQILSKPVDGVPYPHYEYATRLIQWKVGAPIDGDYWYGTAHKVKQWQIVHRLDPDTVTGPQTWASFGL